MRETFLRVAFLATTVLSLSFGCGRDVVLGTDTLNGAGGASDAAADSEALRDAPGCERVWCDPHHLYACGDCQDNDADGLVDMQDPDCLGPCQNTEESFSGAIPGQNHLACEQDCYFDPDSGSGNDGCIWTHACDPLEVAPNYDPEGIQCAYPTDPTAISACITLETQPDLCRSFCGPLTPNGCDCFGCCSIPGAPTPVWAGSTDSLGNPTCDMDHVGDPTRCRPCTQIQSCLNTCEHCELCVGKQQLPADCPSDGGCAAPSCPGGTPCSPCLPPCPAGEACITGCCIEWIR